MLIYKRERIARAEDRKRSNYSCQKEFFHMKSRKEREVQKLRGIMDRISPDRAKLLLEAARRIHEARGKETPSSPVRSSGGKEK